MKIGQPETSMEVVDAGVYAAKVAGVEEAESNYDKPRLKWVFRIADADGETSDIWYWTGATLSTHKLATLRPLVKALFPEADLDDPAYVFDTDLAVGKRCRVLLGIDEERGRNRIEKVMPAEPRKVAGARPAAVRAAAPVAEVDESDDAIPF